MKYNKSILGTKTSKVLCLLLVILMSLNKDGQNELVPSYNGFFSSSVPLMVDAKTTVIKRRTTRRTTYRPSRYTGYSGGSHYTNVYVDGGRYGYHGYSYGGGTTYVHHYSGGGGGVSDVLGCCCFCCIVCCIVCIMIVTGASCDTRSRRSGDPFRRSGEVIVEEEVVEEVVVVEDDFGPPGETVVVEETVEEVVVRED